MSVRHLVLAAVLLPACGGNGGVKDEDLAGLVVAPPEEQTSVDPGAAASDAAELARAFALKHHDVSTAIGAHTVAIKTRYEVKEGDQIVDVMSDDSTLEVAADGGYHATYNNSDDYGREVVFQAGTLYLRPRYARWHRRAPNDKREAAQILDEMYAFAGDYFALVAHAAEVTDKGAAQVGGRDGKRVEIRLAPTPGKPEAQVLTQRKWRETVVVTALSGEAVLDAEMAAPLSASFDATFGFQRDGRSFTMTMHVEQQLSGIGSAVAIATPPPEDTVDTPVRSKELDEHDYLLEGIAPPAKKSGGSDENLPPSGGP